jgi:hypothetical protein
MAQIKFKPDIAGFNALRNSDGVVELLETVGENVRGRAESMNRFDSDPGEAFRVTVVHNQSRAVVFVATASIDGIRAESIDRTLSKAFAG